MREIKFRAWVVNGKVMASWEMITKECDRFSLLKDANFMFMQFTGLQDKNGVDVYDGDILRIPAKSNYDKATYNCFEVFYHDNECIGGYNVGFCMNRMHSHGNSSGGQGYKFTPESIAKNGFVVIGNIHENPELLK